MPSGLRRAQRRPLFSTHELEDQREAADDLSNFVLDGGSAGRIRNADQPDYFKGNANAAEINAELAPMLHDGVVIEIEELTGARPIVRCVHRTL